VIDSGVNPDVSDLTGSVTTGPNLSSVSTRPSNPNWGVHGTWMASLIAGHGHDDGSSGVIGIAPQSRILSIRVIPDRTDPHYGAYTHEQESAIQQSLADAIGYAVRHGAKVISMSIGYGAPSSAVEAALLNANADGVVVIASAGNSGGPSDAGYGDMAPDSFPAEYPGVISVGARASEAAAHSAATTANLAGFSIRATPGSAAGRAGPRACSRRTGPRPGPGRSSPPARTGHGTPGRAAGCRHSRPCT